MAVAAVCIFADGGARRERAAYCYLLSADDSAQARSALRYKMFHAYDADTNIMQRADALLLLI